MLSAAEIVGALEHQTKEERLTVVPWPERDELLRKGETSIDLRLGRWFRSFKQTRTPSVSLVGRIPRDSDEPSETSRTKQHFVPFGSNYVLHPGRFVLGVTLEWLRLPASLSRSEEHTSELQSLMRISYAVFCLKKKKIKICTN